MFGYVKINKSELKVKDYEIYKGVYCSLCKELGHSFSLPARFTLSYDFAFLALLKMARAKKCPGFHASHCTFNPLHKCNCCDKEDESIVFSAYVAMLMFYYKVIDNIQDSGGLKKILMYFLWPFVALVHRKAKKKYPQIDQMISQAMDEQREVENAHDASIDHAAHPSASALAQICAFEEEDEVQKRVLFGLGYAIGRYVYIMDAADDLKSDLKSGSYNAFIEQFQLKKGDAVDAVLPEIDAVLDRTISDIINTYRLLELRRFRDIFDNVVYDGLYTQKNKLLKEDGVGYHE